MRTEHTGATRALCIVALGATVALMTGCPRRSGPLERAGEEIDDVVEDVEEEVDEATE